MEVDKFFDEFERMCKSYKASSCAGCPFQGLHKPGVQLENIPYFVEVVKKWADIHKVKSRKEDLFSKYPHADTKSNGDPVVCAQVLGYKDATCSNCKSCKECWDKPMEEY